MHLPLPEHWLGQPVEEKRAIQESCNNFNTILGPLLHWSPKEERIINKFVQLVAFDSHLM